MTRTVWKYELEIIDDIQGIRMPLNARFLHVGMQGRKVCLWVEVDPNNYITTKLFRIYGTGHPIEINNHSYLGTAIDDSLSLVWHVYWVSNYEVYKEE